MILCLVVEAIVILTLVVIIGWNKGVGDWMESLQRPVVRKLEMSGINSPYAVLMQVKGGKIIGNMKGDEKIYPASMTKIMTVLVAIENLDDLDQEITLTRKCSRGFMSRMPPAGFQPGETVRAIDLLYGAMLPSGAECCIALADTVGGSRDGFVELMNKKAQRIGMNGTHFCDTTGLHDPDHYSTVRDIAVLLRYALRNDTFREIIESPRHSTGVTNIHPAGLHITVPCSKIFLTLPLPAARSWVARQDIPARRVCVLQALQSLRQGIHTGNGRRIGKYRKPAPCGGCGEDL